MAKKIYAIKEGFDFENNTKVEDKIVYSWNECLKYVKGVKGAKYKSFTSMEEADEYLNMGSGFLKKGVDEYPLDKIQAYIDGSYNIATEKYSYGLVVVKNDVILHIENGASEDNASKAIRQIAGELKGSIKALEYARDNGINDLIIIHDYVGVCYHATGFWERKEESSKKYYEDFNCLTKSNDVNVTFVKVDSHTGDLYNEIVDEFAKKAINVPLKGETKKLLKSKELKVKNEALKEKMIEIVGLETASNIIVEEDGLEDTVLREERNTIKEEIEKLKKLTKEENSFLIDYIKKMDGKLKDELIYYLINNV
ncbi:ribonuclease H family protein [Clostridium ganghwense]|uniref:Ribonuclease H family protein n=1 Tax=Clostridium ganghwense TaxID=312089 RepID=A0ABT4CPS5_9CLOT|nr:ribonuclease H family protein [Clostridium ganghwense]MCY6370953.1 ribonuclease H family protein [Clostridium ganghwense]